MYVQNATLPNVDTHPHLKEVSKAFMVDHRYLVYVSVVDKLTHLRVRYYNKNLKDIPYGELFEIKNAILGKDTIAIQVFPKVNDHIDNSHTYHLFTWEGIEVPNLKELYNYEKPKEEIYVPPLPDTYGNIFGNSNYDIPLTC